MLSKEQALELLESINSWCFQDYKNITIFNLLNKYKNEFPESCFYTGIAYRKKDKYTDEFGKMRSCSKIKGANKYVSFLSCRNPGFYQFNCTKAFDLLEIVNYISNKFNLEIPPVHSVFCKLELLTDRLEKEKEIIAVISHDGFCKERT